MKLEKEPTEYTIKELTELYSSQKAKAIYIWLKVFTGVGMYGTVNLISAEEYPPEIPDYYICFKCCRPQYGHCYIGIWEEGNRCILYYPARKRGEKYYPYAYDEKELPKSFHHLMFAGLRY